MSKKKQSLSRFVVLVSQQKAMNRAVYFCSQWIKRGPSQIDLVYFDQDQVAPVQWRSIGELASEEARDAAEQVLQFYAKNIYDMTNQMPVIHYQVGNHISQLFDILDNPEYRDVPTWLILPLDEKRSASGKMIHDLLFKKGEKLRVPIVICPNDISYKAIDMLY